MNLKNVFLTKYKSQMEAEEAEMKDVWYEEAWLCPGSEDGSKGLE